MSRQFITEVPHFNSLVEINDAIKSCQESLVGLSEGGDVVQRATDLRVVATNLLEVVDSIVFEEQ